MSAVKTLYGKVSSSDLLDPRIQVHSNDVDFSFAKQSRKCLGGNF